MCRSCFSAFDRYEKLKMTIESNLDQLLVSQEHESLVSSLQYPSRDSRPVKRRRLRVTNGTITQSKVSII